MRVLERQEHTEGSSAEGYPEAGTLKNMMHEETLIQVGLFSLEKGSRII